MRGLGVWVVLAGAPGCTQPATPGATSGSQPQVQPPVVDPKQNTDTAAHVPVPVVTEPVEPVVPAPTDGGETLDGRTMTASSEGGWTLRKAGAGAVGVDDVGAPSYSRVETIGKGGGRGAGVGYGSGGGGARPVKSSAGVKFEGEVDGAMKAAEAKGPLKAGSTDDNSDFKGYLKFLETWASREGVRGDFQPLDVAGRVFIKIVDGDRVPLPGVAITVSDPRTKAPLWKATTYGDGRAPYYPKLFGPAVQQGGRLEVAAKIGGKAVSTTWDGQSDLTLAGDGPVQASPGLALDVVFLIDTTGSMGDELEQIKSSLLAVTGELQGKRADLQLRYAAVAYKDIDDDYVTMAHPFTDDTAAFSEAMQALTASGGGDLPESLNQGFNRAVEGLEWRPEAAKVVFLVADAPPQMRFKGDVLYGDSAVRAVGLGIRVHSVAASGLDPLGTLVLRQVAQLTRGKFIFIEYGGTQKTAAKHGVTGPVDGGNNLDQILLAQLTEEIEGWGK